MGISEKEWFTGWMLLQQLAEQVSPVRIGSAYLWKEALREKVQQTIKDLAPHGVSSQGEYLELLNQALNLVSEQFKKQTSDEAMLADLDLTTSMIERTLRMVPYQVIFADNQ